MVEVASHDLVVLPPIADDPIFADDLYGESTTELQILTDANVDLPARPASDPHDFAALFMRHRWSFALHARRFLTDERDVDEVVQEGFLRLFLAMPELETELQVLAYCRRTISNLCIDRYRADQRRPRLLDLETVTLDAFPDDDEIDPIVQAEDAAIVRQALAMLSPIHREALIKREVEEKSLPQIAAELDITVEQTKHLLHRARRSLRRLLVGTHVEPGVDLDLATILAANRERAARAAKPTGAAVMSLLLVFASVLGLRVLGDRPTSVATLPPAGALGSLLPTPTAPGALPPQSLPRVAGVATPRRAAKAKAAASAPVTPRALSRRPDSGPPPVPSAAAGGAPLAPSAPAPAPGRPTADPRPPVGPAPVPPPAPTLQAFSVTGLLKSVAVPQVSLPESFVAPSGSEASLHRFEAGTADGPLRLVQTITRFPDGGLTFAVEPSLPVEGSPVSVDLSQTITTVDRRYDGTVAVSLVGSFALGDAGSPPVAAPLGELTPAWPTPFEQQLRVTLLYSSDLASVVAEHVTVGEAGASQTALPVPVWDLPDSTPVPAQPSAPVALGVPTNIASIDAGNSAENGRDQTALPSS